MLGTKLHQSSGQVLFDEVFGVAFQFALELKQFALVEKLLGHLLKKDPRTGLINSFLGQGLLIQFFEPSHIEKFFKAQNAREEVELLELLSIKIEQLQRRYFLVQCQLGLFSGQSIHWKQLSSLLVQKTIKHYRHMSPLNVVVVLRRGNQQNGVVLEYLLG